MSIQAAAQSPNTGARVELFALDATNLGAEEVFLFCSSKAQSGAVVYDGNTYVPIPVEATGFEANTEGSLPTPRLKIGNVTRVLSSLVTDYADLVGAQLTRIRTFKQFLDGEPDADPNAYFAPDQFKIERKVTQNKVFIEWELSADLDQEGRKLPGMQCVRDVCPFRYRRWNGSSFTYPDVTLACPYTGTAYFTENDVATTAANDRCGKRLSSCKARFGTNSSLPFGGFPGLSRTRV